MPTARRSIPSPFVLEKSKLTRLLEVTDTKLNQNGYTVTKKFTLNLKGERVIECGTLEEVFATDNSARHRIEQLSLTSFSHPADGDPEAPSERLLTIEFDGRSPVDAEIYVRGLDSSWVRETFSTAEEQVERTLQRSLMSRISIGGSSRSSFAAAILGVLFAFMSAFFLDIQNSHPSSLASTMWLSDQDLKELEPLQADPTLTKEKIGEILSRQVRNLITQRSQRQQPLLGRLLHWRPLLILSPVVMVILAFGYLLFRCYPSAVFLWGDAEDWYKSILNQRKVVWLGIILALGVGILGNLFVFALASH